jgi:hypothetical protein
MQWLVLVVVVRQRRPLMQGQAAQRRVVPELRQALTEARQHARVVAVAQTLVIMARAVLVAVVLVAVTVCQQLREQ